MGIFLNQPSFLMNHIRPNMVAISILLQLVSISDESVTGVLHDYCEKDYFQVECPSGTIVVVQEARFGRMELGTCLTADFGYLNCYSDVLPLMDSWCSGRQLCSVQVFSLVDFRNACTEQLPSYLQSRYTCETVMVPESHCCQGPERKVILRENEGLISNYMTHTSGCGGIDCPWILSASLGQKINISLFDFSTYQTTDAVVNGEIDRETQDRRCNIYAKIKEDASGGRVTVCSGESRYRHLYTTLSNTVEIQIINRGDSNDESAYFVIQFQAFGCSNPTPPTNGLIDRQGDRAYITCASNNFQWEIVCREGAWHGDFGKCAENGTGFGENDDNSYFTREVYMVLVIAIAFVLAVAIVTAGIVCVYRHWSRIPLNGRGRPSHFSHIQSPDGTYLASEFNYSLPRKREYDSVGYKHHTLDGNSQLDPRFMKNIKPDREHDKGYYSDRTYESPICDHGPTAGRGSMGYHTVNPTRSVTENIPSDNFGSHTNSNLTVMPRSGIPNLPVGDTHFKVNAHLVA